MRSLDEQTQAGLVAAIILLMAVAFFIGALCTQIANHRPAPPKPVPTGVIQL
jgi:hypothetical protein